MSDKTIRESLDELLDLACDKGTDEAMGQTFIDYAVYEKNKESFLKRIENPWISVEDRLPDELCEVMAWAGDKYKQCIAYFGGGRWVNDDTGKVLGYTQKNPDGFVHKIEGVTHWMPLPEPPK